MEARAPDALEFERLYRARRGAVLGYVIRRAGRTDAEDLVAEIFLISWRRRFEIPRQELPWLLGVARNVLLHHQRRTGRAEGLLVPIDEASDLATAGFDEVVAERHMVLGALRVLSENDRELLLLTAWDGLTTPEAARVLEISTTTARVRLHRVRRRYAVALLACDEARSTNIQTSTPPGGSS